MERAAMSLRTTVIHVLQPIKVAVELATLIGQQLTLSDLKAESYGLGFKLKITWSGRLTLKLIFSSCAN